MHSRPALALACLALATPSAAQAPIGDTLIKDVKPGDQPLAISSNAALLCETASFTLFGATLGDNGLEPWVTDGTPGGTLALGELNPGLSSSVAFGDSPRAAAVHGGAVFSAYDGASGFELWRTDGTPQGTSMLADLHPGSLSSDPRHFSPLGGLVYLLAWGPSGRDLWRTDGTPGGTQLAAALDLSGLGFMTVAEGRLWIFDAMFTQDPTLLASDGTPAGTHAVRAFDGYVQDGAGRLGVGLNGRVIFAIAKTFGGGDAGVWASDGTAAGTVKLAACAQTRWIHRLGDQVIFAVDQGPGGATLFATDGTPLGTVALASYSFPTDGLSYDLREPVEVGGALVFSASTPATGAEIYRTDGTPGGTYLVHQILGNHLGSDPLGLIAFGGKAYFTAFNFAVGRELWRTDGTAAGTELVLELVPGADGPIFGGFGSRWLTPNGLVFTATHAKDGVEPYVTDGTAAGTSLLADLAPEPPNDADVQHLTRAGLRVVFSARDGVHGSELWASDGTSQGTQRIQDLAPGGADGGPYEMVSLGHAAVLVGGPDSNRELWVTDGTSAGTHQLGEIHPTAGSKAEQLTVAEDRVYFVADDGVHGSELWVTDGTEAGTRMVLDVWPAVTSSSMNKPLILGAAGTRVFFYWRTSNPDFTADTGYEVFVSDGTAAGTHLVADLVPGSGSLDFFQAHPFGEKLAIVWDDGVHGFEPWITDGTLAGTHVLDLKPGPEGSHAQRLSRVGDLLLLCADDGTTSYLDLWSSDGTLAGTHKLLSQAQVDPFLLAPSWAAGGPGPLAWFRLGGAVGAQRLWRTDGTAAGTVLVHAYTLPPHDEVANALTGAGGFVAFTGHDAAGAELWVGEASGGVLALADSSAGPGHALPRTPVRAGSYLFFVADDGIHGEELHAVPFTATGTFDAAPFGPGCASSGDPAELGFTGALALGASASIELEGAAPGALAPVFFDGAPAAYALGAGCTGFLAAPKHLASVVASPAGAASIPIAVPAQPALAGATLYLQAVVLVPGGPFLGALELSSALEVVLGP